VRTGTERWQAAARRVFQEMQDAGGIEEAFREALRLADACR
jgi:hypothetical protein